MSGYTKRVSLPGKNPEQLYNKICTEIRELLPPALSSKFKITPDPAKKTFRLESSYLTASLQCLDGEILIEGKLSLIASVFRSQIDEGIDQWVQKNYKKNPKNTA